LSQFLLSGTEDSHKKLNQNPVEYEPEELRKTTNQTPVYYEPEELRTATEGSVGHL
jgi:hypothetical protein